MFKGLLFFVKFSWREQKSYIFLNVLNQLLAGVLPLIIVTAPKYIIDELLEGKRLEIIAVYVGILLLANFLNDWLLAHISFKIFNRRCILASRFDKFMHTKLANTDFCNLESPEFYDMKEKANKFLYGDWHGFSYVLESAFQIMGKMFTLIGIIAIISTMNVALVIIFLLMVLASAVVDFKAKEKAHRLTMEAVEIERKWNYFTRILEDAAYAKEIRLNHLSEWLIDSEQEYTHKAIAFYKKRNSYFSRSGLFGAFFGLIQNVATYAYLVYKVVKNTISIGNFTMYVSAAASFSGAVRDVLTSVLDIKVYGIYYEAMEKYLNIKETLRENKRLPLPDKENFVLSFRNVSFQYPGQENFALKNINIEIKSGTKLSIVGENGSGKTTFVKLLCRLYDPTEGEILFNGINIKDIDYDQYMNIFSAIFQDFKLFAFSIRDNIVWNDTSQAADQKAEKLLRNVGMGRRIDSLPKGIDTTVYKEFDSEGFEPSGGEGQKIAIARAIARESKVVILDEPLSALDPKAEYEIFQQFDALIQNKTAVYISHRLSSCRFCDSIAVFHAGDICEYGTHEELIKQNGKYSELYNLQAQYYVD